MFLETKQSQTKLQVKSELLEILQIEKEEEKEILILKSKTRT